ncbi:hypothetical protein H310_03292 [Aphanomyces invadans]|uniref:Uncharacterized protein n=1 Tax=Aphanomyces invadans TaxID=157072 RepID=A0A024UH70_9STRA|nr:hypothetical protein H310_03292 [Aphanomyces invadans]ETW05540.1 hypothetical protein H310_03292 [Aphanomyces invadans]|eukprot:XP_008865317.1 hypothetical protein H310_03292 [Aphanomyces invadans]
MYEALSMVDVSPQRVTMPQDVPVKAYCMDMHIPASNEAGAEELWKWVCSDPNAANVTLTRVLLHDSAALRTLAHLHAWHRWMVATRLPQISSFQSSFAAVFGVHPTAAFLATAFGQHASVRASSPPTLDVALLDIELALAAFELMVATQSAPYFYSEPLLVVVTQQPVIWFPVHKTHPMLASYTLWGLLHSTVGHQIVADMRKDCPSELLDVLALLQSREYRYCETQMVKFDVGAVPTLSLGAPYCM